MAYPTKSGVYAIRHKISGKVYIGSATHISTRISGHKYLLRHNNHTSKYLQHAWNKYGVDAFEFIVLEITSRDNLADREQYWLDYYKAYKQNNGYNILAKAYSNIGFTPSKRTRKIWSQQRKGRKSWNSGMADISSVCPKCSKVFVRKKWQKRKFCGRLCSNIFHNPKGRIITWGDKISLAKRKRSK